MTVLAEARRAAETERRSWIMELEETEMRVYVRKSAGARNASHAVSVATLVDISLPSPVEQKRKTCFPLIGASYCRAVSPSA